MNGTEKSKELRKFGTAIDLFGDLIATVDSYRGWHGNRHGVVEMLAKMESILRKRRIHELGRPNRQT